MITNKQIDLSKNSSVRIDAINTIKYTLLLNYKIPDYDNNELQFIDNIFKNCHECCYRLFFNDSPENFQKNFRYNFFGIIPFPNETQSLFDSIGVLPAIYDDSTSYGENTFDFSYKSPPLHQLLLNHCIMSSYHAIVSELQKYDFLTSYSIAKGNHLSIIYSKQNNTLNKIADSNAANFQKKTTNRLSVLPFVADLASIQLNNDNNKDQKSVLFFKQFTELLYTICSIHQTPFNYFFKENKTKNRIKNYTVLCNNISKICNKQNQYYDSKTHLFKNRIPECIYNSYLFERIFNFRLFYSTINLIQYINKQQQYRLDINDFVSAFSSFTSLPNVLVDNYF